LLEYKYFCTTKTIDYTDLIENEFPQVIKKFFSGAMFNENDPHQIRVLLLTTTEPRPLNSTIYSYQIKTHEITLLY
jgi:hypothetical protein